MPAVLDNIAPIGNERLEQVYGEIALERTKPPHHLLETQIFSHLQKNDIFQVEPEQLSFLVNKSTKAKRVKVINRSGARQNFHVIEPINQNRWQISYIKPDGGLVPGGNVEIQVKFITPTQREKTTQDGAIYQDSIRLHCSGGNLVIPLYAYPTIDAKDFPQKINFGSVPLGQENQRTITLDVTGNESFDFSCSLSPSSRAFSVSPWSGTISGETLITICYCPTEFVTSSTTLQISFSTFDRKVLKCQINGNCLPGLLTMKKKREFELQRRASYMEKARRANNISDKQIKLNLMSEISEENQKTKSKNRKPKEPKNRQIKESNQPERIKIGAQHHINKILNNKDLKADKRDAHSQAYFEAANKFRVVLREATEAEKMNKLRWQVRIGDDIPSPEDIQEIKNKRIQNNTPIDGRTERDALSKPDYTPNFDLYRNSPWRGRHFALVRFQQAARTVLIRIRAEDRLSSLRKLMKLVNAGMTVNAAEATLTGSLDESKIFEIFAPSSSRPYVKDFSPSCVLFNQWHIQNSFTDEVTEEQLPMENDSEKVAPIYHPLVTPEYYALQGYHADHAYNWKNKVDDLTLNSTCQTEETSFEILDWSYEDLDSALNNYNILSGKKEERRVQKGGQRLSRWNSVTQGMNSTSNPKL